MNKDNAKDYLPFVQALAEGKTIQCGKYGEWIDIEDLSFDAAPENYRIKPEPRDIWVNEAVDGISDVYSTEEDAKRCAGPYSLRVAVHYSEVVE